MSGIFGLINKKPFSFDINRELQGLQIWNLTYGKNAKKTIQKPDFFIGCCQERINYSIAVSEPIITDDNCYYSIDAIIYNREELIKNCNETKNVSDEKLLISYIKANGITALKNINGDFAGAIYNYKKKELLLFRDHMGIRPLFYFINDDFVAFSTDIRGITGILRANITLDEDWVYNTLSGYISLEQTNTEYKNVFCVKPGGFLKISIKNDKFHAVIKPYWELGKKKVHLQSDAKYQTRLKELITDSIKRRLDVVPENIGAELSGGLDSGVIDILINRLGKNCLYYSWSHSPEILPYADHDERQIINDICKQEGITCHYFEKMSEFAAPLYRNIELTGIKLPKNNTIADYAFPSYINTLKICETSLFMNHKGVSIVFSGHGGDEGVSHRENPYEIFYNHEYYHYLRYMWSRSSGKQHRLFETLRMIKNNIKDNKKIIHSSFVSPVNAKHLIKESFAQKHKKDTPTTSYFAIDAKKYIMMGGSRNRLDNVSLQGAHCNVRYILPYLDYRVIDYAVSIPRYQFLRGRRDRYIFRETFKDIIPQSLYRVVDKSENSRTNILPNPNWYEGYLKLKKDTLSLLDKKIWDNYIDFEKLNAFDNKEKPSKEEREQDYKTLQCLSTCIAAQIALNKSKEISSELKKV